MNYQSTKILDLGSCAFRQWKAEHSHCKFVHGYKLQAKFWFSCSTLDDKNWVVDFGGLSELKDILARQFDHTLCVAGDDPLLAYFQQLHDLGAVDLRVMESGVGIERTAEWCFEQANTLIRKLTKERCWVDKVEVWEHDKNSAIATHGYRTVPQQNPYITGKHIAEQFELNLNDKPEAVAQPIPEPVATAVAAPAPEVQAAVQNNPVAAPVGNKVTTGWSNPFGGTSWGR